jgi:hypothetical protein
LRILFKGERRDRAIASFRAFFQVFAGAMERDDARGTANDSIRK